MQGLSTGYLEQNIYVVYNHNTRPTGLNLINLNQLNQGSKFLLWRFSTSEAKAPWCSTNVLLLLLLLVLLLLLLLLFLVILRQSLTSCGVDKCHCLVQLWDCDPVRWILESSHIQYQHKISAWMVAPNWREMTGTRLTQTSSKIRNHNHFSCSAGLGRNQGSKFLLRCFCTNSECLNIQCIADGKAGKLVECDSRFFNYLNTELTIKSTTTFTTHIHIALSLNVCSRVFHLISFIPKAKIMTL